MEFNHREHAAFAQQNFNRSVSKPEPAAAESAVSQPAPAVNSVPEIAGVQTHNGMFAPETKVETVESSTGTGTSESNASQEFATGVVAECKKLNLRAEPNTDAEIRTVLPVGTELIVYVDESTEDFYKVCTAAGVEGFCMRKFIIIQD